MKTIWFIDDEVEILECLTELIGIDGRLDNFTVRTVTSWSECKQVPGDTVVHDLCGVGDQNKIEGVTYYCCSGSDPKLSDFPKPFDIDGMIDKIVA